MPAKTALIAGASGLIGRRIAEHLIATGGWDVIGLARSARTSAGMRWIAVDLNDPADCARKLGELNEVTHVFYAARYDHPEGVPESVEINTAMLVNLVRAVESVAQLEHVHAVHGSKYYGTQLGPVPVPLTEDSARANNRNFYFEQEDFLRAQSRGKRWSYSTSRPHSFCDPAVDYARSASLVIAVYAAVQRELGLALDFPGTPASFEVRTEFTDTALLARCIAWMAQEPRCANQSFHVINGDYPRWADLWPGIAQIFGMPAGAPGNVKLAAYMADKGGVWDGIVKKHGLKPTKLAAIALWPYGDYLLRPEWEIHSSMNKARAAGFSEALDSGEMFAGHFAHYRTEKIIP
ncbi:MAG: SDR family oxidoreductase [Burkholderiales bacterium]